MPIDSSTSSGITASRKVGLKYGGPTETVPLPEGIGDQRRERPAKHGRRGDHQQDVVEQQEVLARQQIEARVGLQQRRAPGISSAPRRSHDQEGRMKMPGEGSAAKECTDTSTPERTRKVPSRLRENARIASSSVQLLNRPRFSVTAREWISAVPTSHGMNEAFSTGSHNQ